MSLSASALSSAIKTNLTARAWFRGSAVEAQQFCDDLAGAIVAHITANALVIPTALVAPPGGGAVTGTGTIT